MRRIVFHTGINKTYKFVLTGFPERSDGREKEKILDDRIPWSVHGVGRVGDMAQKGVEMGGFTHVYGDLFGGVRGFRTKSACRDFVRSFGRRSCGPCTLSRCDRLNIRLRAKVLLPISGGCPLAAPALSLTPEATPAVPGNAGIHEKARGSLPGLSACRFLSSFLLTGLR